MNDRVLVLSTKLTLDTSLSNEMIEEFSSLFFDINESEVTVPCCDWIDKASFEEDFDNLRVFARQIKNKLKGDVLVYVRNAETDTVTQGRYKCMAKEITFEECELNISIKKGLKEKPKALTEEEKIALFREYWELKHQIPGKSETYKGFRIGTFFNTMMKNQNMIEILNNIMKDEVGTE